MEVIKTEGRAVNRQRYGFLGNSRGASEIRVGIKTDEETAKAAEGREGRSNTLRRRLEVKTGAAMEIVAGVTTDIWKRRETKR